MVPNRDVSKLFAAASTAFDNFAEEISKVLACEDISEESRYALTSVYRRSSAAAAATRDGADRLTRMMEA